MTEKKPSNVVKRPQRIIMSTDSVSVSGSGSLDETAAEPDELTRQDPEIERNVTVCVIHQCTLCNMVFGSAQALGGHRSNSSHHRLRLQGQDPKSKPVLKTSTTTAHSNVSRPCFHWEIECLLNDNHQKGKMIHCNSWNNERSQWIAHVGQTTIN